MPCPQVTLPNDPAYSLYDCYYGKYQDWLYDTYLPSQGYNISQWSQTWRIPPSSNPYCQRSYGGGGLATLFTNNQGTALHEVRAVLAAPCCASGYTANGVIVVVAGSAGMTSASRL